MKIVHFMGSIFYTYRNDLSVSLCIGGIGIDACAGGKRHNNDAINFYKYFPFFYTVIYCKKRCVFLWLLFMGINNRFTIW